MKAVMNPQLVAVGSLNPVKIRATVRAVDEVFPASTVRECQVPSGVSVQPMTTEEALQGSCNRARSALNRYRADYGVGLEGGLSLVDDQWFCIGWATVVSASGVYRSAPAPGVAVPLPVIQLVLEDGLELGDAEDQVFGLQNSKQSTGLIGIVTHGLIDRELTFYLPILAALCSLSY